MSETKKRLLVLFLACLIFLIYSALPVSAEVNTSFLATNFTVQDFTFSSSTYVDGIAVSFNTTNTSTYYILMTSMNILKSTGAGTNEVWTNISIDGIQILEEKLRTVTKPTGGDIDEGSSGTKPVRFNVSVGEHNITFAFKRTGDGAIEINDIDINLGQLWTTANRTVRGELSDANIVHSSTNFVAPFNWSINKTGANSSTFIAGKFTLQGTAAATTTYAFKNLEDNSVSPYWQRYLSDAADIGSVSGNYIESNEYALHNHSLYSGTTVGTVTVNGTIIDFDMRDKDNNTINYFQRSNASTNITNTLTLTAGTHLLANDTVAVDNGTGVFLAMTTSFTSASGAQTPIYFINSTELSEANCYSKKERFLSGSSDIGNAFIYKICDGATIGNNYTFNLWVTVESGETLIQLDESLSGFEVTDFTTLEINTPPIVAIISPDSNVTLAGTFEINASVVDQNDDAFLSNVSISNSTTSTLIATNIPQTNLSVSFDSTTVSDGTYNITWISCGNETSDAFCGNHTIEIMIDNVPVISNVAATQITHESAVITWATNEVANSSVNYGASTALGTLAVGAPLVTSHSIGLTNLVPGTLYYYNVTSCDSAGNCTSSGIFNFTTELLSNIPVSTGGSGRSLDGIESSRGESIKGKVKHQFNREDMWIEEITYDIVVSTPSIMIKQEVLSENPTKEELKGPHKFILLKHSLDVSQLTNIMLRFKVPKDWIMRHGMTLDDINVKHYDEESDEWEPLPTNKIITDENYVYYNAKSSGLNLFAAGERLSRKTKTIMDTYLGENFEGEKELVSEKAASEIKEKGESGSGKKVVLSLLLLIIGGYVCFNLYLKSGKGRHEKLMPKYSKPSETPRPKKSLSRDIKALETAGFRVNTKVKNRLEKRKLYK
ncbi:MAG: PGF-pre-PGF domain-containing protein [Nanoarchaeota archaeon]|nr:PGF-pre-PGF domain-containing protein [Nanoarchaeota archaeon]